MSNRLLGGAHSEIRRFQFDSTIDSLVEVWATMELLVVDSAKPRMLGSVVCAAAEGIAIPDSGEEVKARIVDWFAANWKKNAGCCVGGCEV